MRGDLFFAPPRVGPDGPGSRERGRLARPGRGARAATRGRPAGTGRTPDALPQPLQTTSPIWTAAEAAVARISPAKTFALRSVRKLTV